jgi:hypothetical protein
MQHRSLSARRPSSTLRNSSEFLSALRLNFRLCCLSCVCCSKRRKLRDGSMSCVLKTLCGLLLVLWWYSICMIKDVVASACTQALLSLSSNCVSALCSVSTHFNVCIAQIAVDNNTLSIRCLETEANTSKDGSLACCLKSASYTTKR